MCSTLWFLTNLFLNAFADGLKEVNQVKSASSTQVNQDPAAASDSRSVFFALLILSLLLRAESKKRGEQEINRMKTRNSLYYVKVYFQESRVRISYGDPSLFHAHAHAHAHESYVIMSYPLILVIQHIFFKYWPDMGKISAILLCFHTSCCLLDHNLIK